MTPISPEQTTTTQVATQQMAVEQTIANPVLQTAQIIPFPVRPMAQPAELLPHERLARALETLNAALTEQRTAIAAWRAALAELKTTASGLGDSLQRYRASLGTLGEDVSALQTQATVLRDWADRVAPTQE